MSNQTLQRSTTKRRERAKTPSKSVGRRGAAGRQTARLEGRRDGKPLIFGWGAHLTRAQKSRYQRGAIFLFGGIVAALLIFVAIFGVVQQNYIIPNETIVTVNGTHVTQDTYRKALAVRAEESWNRLQDYLKQQGALQPKIQAGDKAAATQNAVLTQDIVAEEGAYSSSSISQTTMDQIIEDLLIQRAAKQFEAKGIASSTFEPTAKLVQDKLDAFKAAFPSGQSYGTFLSKNGMSDADARVQMTREVRRDLMESYLKTLVTSPTRQAHYRLIQSNSAKASADILAQIQKDPSDANWSKLAKQDSLDVTSKNVGGDSGWLAFGTGDAVIEQWVLNTSRKPGDISGVIKDVNGTYDVVQVIAIDPSRPLDKDKVSNAQSVILDHWLGGQRNDGTNHVSTANQNMMTATRNLPKMPDLNAQLPQEKQQGNPITGSGNPLG